MSAEVLLSLFSGLERAHGEYNIDGQKGSKATGRAFTKKEPVTVELWRAHLRGKKGLGIIPITDDHTVFFGAIDIDVYDNFDPVEVANTVERHDWPLVVCRSKSGGAHVFIFLKEQCTALALRGILRQFAMALGHPKAELFPKQDRLYSKEDVGNWINMPYFDEKNTLRYAIEKGSAINLKRFIELAEERSTTIEELEHTKINSDEFSDAPPCLEQLTITGFPPGSMNNGLFNMGVYARMKFPDDWQRKVHDYNDRFMGPGDAKEVQAILRSLDKKKYVYMCQESPICGMCNKSICNRRKYGIASENSPYKSGGSKKEGRPCILDEIQPPVECHVPPVNSDDEPYWIFYLHGIPMDVSVDMVSSQMKFVRAYLKKFHKVLLPIDENRWAAAMNEILDQAEIIEMAPDAGPEGQLMLHLETFCTGKVQARTQDELILGKPYTDNGRTYFRSQDLMKYLEIQRFKEFSERQLYAIFRRHGAAHHKLMIKGKCVGCWSVLEFNKQLEGFEVPDVRQGAF